ncbi:MAG: hypothetical protein JNJ73_03125 [Hyphomonadaceae bacterium]|nr:hypothetical protein [Hyphomonadaceae bacterium]
MPSGGDAGVMRTAFVLAIVILAMGSATAQQAPRPIWQFEPNLQRSPVPEGMRFYPKEALRREVIGRAILCCTPRDDGSLACRVGYEAPVGWGFGASALRVFSSLMRMPPDKLAEYKATWPGREFAVPMNFRLEPDERELPPLTKEEQAAMCEARAVS